MCGRGDDPSMHDAPLGFDDEGTLIPAADYRTMLIADHAATLGDHGGVTAFQQDCPACAEGRDREEYRKAADERRRSGYWDRP